jgi:hypothetical protein
MHAEILKSTSKKEAQIEFFHNAQDLKRFYVRLAFSFALVGDDDSGPTDQ